MSIQCIFPWDRNTKSVVFSIAFLAGAVLATGIALTILKGHSPLSIGFICAGGSLLAIALSYVIFATCKAKEKQ